MLTAVFYVLKIMGCVFLGIIGVILLLLLFLLFVPIKYTGKMHCPSSPAQVKVRFCAAWLLNLVRLDVVYNKDCLKWRFRIAWKKIMGKEGKNNEKNQESNHQDNFEIRNQADSHAAVAKQKKAKKGSQSSETCPQEFQKEKKAFSQQHEETQKKRKNRKENLWKKIRRKIKKIKCTFQGLCDKIEEVKEFIDDDLHREAFSIVVRHMKPLAASIFSGNISGNIVFGFEDPYNTGLCLAACGIVYPLTGGQIEIVPDFERKVFSGCLKIGGRWRVFHVALFALRILLSGRVRKTYKDLKIIQEGTGS